MHDSGLVKEATKGAEGRIVPMSAASIDEAGCVELASAHGLADTREAQGYRATPPRQRAYCHTLSYTATLLMPPLSARLGEIAEAISYWCSQTRNRLGAHCQLSKSSYHILGYAQRLRDSYRSKCETAPLLIPETASS